LQSNKRKKPKEFIKNRVVKKGGFNEGNKEGQGK
jgi:hypothetical protein